MADIEGSKEPLMNKNSSKLLALALFVAGNTSLVSPAGRDCASMMNARVAGVMIQKTEQTPLMQA
jgi:hypothetical protein